MGPEDEITSQPGAPGAIDCTRRLTPSVWLRLRQPVRLSDRSKRRLLFISASLLSHRPILKRPPGGVTAPSSSEQQAAATPAAARGSDANANEPPSRMPAPSNGIPGPLSEAGGCPGSGEEGGKERGRATGRRHHALRKASSFPRGRKWPRGTGGTERCGN